MRNNDLVFAVSPMSGAQIEADAMGIIKRFSPHLLVQPGPFDVLNFYDHILTGVYGLNTGVDAAMADGVEGMAWPDGRVDVSEETYDSACDHQGRARFTIVHEGYHGIRHRGQIKRVLIHTGEAVLYRRHSIPAYRDPEWQANRFAAALLMPSPMVRMLGTQVGIVHLVDAMTTTFRVSRKAARFRAEQVLGKPAQ